MAGEQLTFYGFKRSSAALRPGLTALGGRLTGKLKLGLRDSRSNTRVDGEALYALMGPPDVKGLMPGAVVRTYPVAGAINVVPDKCVYAELAEADLPWRYSPLASDGAALRPWLVLVVGTRDEIRLLPGNRVGLRGAVLQQHPLTKSAVWAHVQKDPNGVETARLLSPRDLASLKNQQLIAVIVPAFQVDTNGMLRDSWPHEPLVTLPAYHLWYFHRSDTGDGFKDMAQKLRGLATPPGLGYAPMAYQTADDVDQLQPTLLVGGALVSPEAPPSNVHVAREALGEESDDVNAVRNHLKALRANAALKRDAKRRPIVQMPIYGEPWVDDVNTLPTWSESLNSDPRYRGPAGLGLWAGITLQEEIVTAASRQLGAFYVAAQRIRQLTLGLAATRCLWNSRLPQDDTPAARAHRLMIFGPSLARFATPDGRSILEQITASDRPLPPALFSAAARRLLRPGTPHQRLSQPGATSPLAVFDVANDCERFDRPERVFGRLPHADRWEGGVALDELAGAMPVPELGHVDGEDLDQLQREEEDGPTQWPEWRHQAVELLNSSRGFRALIPDVVTREPDRSCAERQVNWQALSNALREALDPMSDNAFIIRRVLATIEGLDDQPLTPPEMCLDFHLPAWQFLNQHAREWLLPGVGEIKFTKPGPDGQPVEDRDKHPVFAVRTNALFTEAFMVGFNQQALSELRWRNVPVQAGCTPLRRFWEPVGDADEVVPDLVGIHNWPKNSPLGDESHEAPAVQGDNLVLAFRTELFRRYPNTLVYLAPRVNPTHAIDGSGRWTEDVDVQKATRIEPNLQVAIDRDVMLFGFKESPAVLDNHWVVVEEVPQGYSFYNNANDVKEEDRENYKTAADGGKFADAAFANPIRVAIQGTRLKPNA